MAKLNKHIVITIRLLGNRSGGAERLYCELANHLVDMGYKVSCLTYEAGNGKPFYPLRAEVNLINLFVPNKSRSFIGKAGNLFSVTNEKNLLLSIPHFLKSNIDYIFQLRRFYKGNDVDISISYLPPANTPSILAALFTKVKTIATNHNVPEQDYESNKRWSQNPIDKYLRKKMVCKATIIHVLFDSFGLWFNKKVSSKLHTINNYVPNDYFDEPILPANRENLIIAVGRLAPVKNYIALLKAWVIIKDEFPDWKVEIFGVGPQKSEMKQLINQNGINDSFVLKGHTKDIKSEYDRARILCHPALYEGFGLSVAEGLSRHLPVVAYKDCEGVNQFVIDHVNGLMIERENEVDSLATALRQLIQSSQLRNDLSNSARDSITHFSEEKYYENWINLLSKLTGESENG